MQHYQAITPGCCTNTSHVRRLAYLLSLEQAWPDSTATSTASRQHRQTSADADEQKRQWTTSCSDARNGRHTERRCSNAQTPTEAIFPSTWEGNHHRMEKTGLLIWRPFGQPYGLQWPQGGLPRTNRRPTKAPKTPHPPYPTEPTPLTSCHGQQAPLQLPKIGR